MTATTKHRNDCELKTGHKLCHCVCLLFGELEPPRDGYYRGEELARYKSENRRLKEINVSLSSQLKIAISFLGALDDNGLYKYIDRMNSAIDKSEK